MMCLCVLQSPFITQSGNKRECARTHDPNANVKWMNVQNDERLSCWMDFSNHICPIMLKSMHKWKQTFFLYGTRQKPMTSILSQQAPLYTCCFHMDRRPEGYIHSLIFQFIFHLHVFRCNKQHFTIFRTLQNKKHTTHTGGECTTEHSRKKGLSLFPLVIICA